MLNAHAVSLFMKAFRNVAGLSVAEFYERAFGNSYSLPGFGPRGKVQNKMQELDDVLAQ